MEQTSGESIQRQATVREPMADAVLARLGAAIAGATWRETTFALYATAMMVGVITVVLRAINLGDAFDVYSDEVVYSQISHTFAETLRITFQGWPAYTHPPLFFYLEGAYLRLFSHTADPVQLVLSARYLNVALAGLSAGLMFVIGRRVAGWWAGVVAAMIFALDPFVIKISSRNLLEPSALFWVLGGYAVLFTAARGGPTAWRIALAGLAFGAALLTEEVSAFQTFVPLAFCFVLNWSIPRRAAVLVASIPCLMYGGYLAAMAAAGQWTLLSQSKFDGIRRLFGTMHVSGYGHADRTGQSVAPGTAAPLASPIAAGHGSNASASFTQAILNNLSQFATTYVLIALGVVAIAVLLPRVDGRVRLLTLWTMSAYALQAYSIKFGTNEEQFYYYLVAPSLLAVVTAVTLTLRSGRLSSDLRRWAMATVALGLVVFASWGGYNWVDRHTASDNGYQRLFAYMDAHVPQGSLIAATNFTSDHLLYARGYKFGYWGTVAQLERNNARYAIVSSQLIASGYDVGTPALYDWLRKHGTRLYAFKDTTYGVLALYGIPPAVQTAGSVAGSG